MAIMPTMATAAPATPDDFSSAMITFPFQHRVYVFRREDRINNARVPPEVPVSAKGGQREFPACRNVRFVSCRRFRRNTVRVHSRPHRRAGGQTGFGCQTGFSCFFGFSFLV